MFKNFSFNSSYIIIPLITILTSLVGGLATQTGMTDGFYETLNKPSFNPPSWIFGPVWTTIYILTTASALIAWNKLKRDFWWKIIILLFGYNALVNTLWSVAFFGLGEIGVALFIALEIWGSVLLLIIFMWRRSLVASLLLLPYLLWVSFAIYLNYAIWLIN